MEQPIAETNIKGLRWRDLIAIIACTVTIVATVLGAKESIKGDIREMRTINAADARLYDLKFSTVETMIKALQIQQDILRNDIKNLENNHGKDN